MKLTPLRTKKYIRSVLKNEHLRKAVDKAAPPGLQSHDRSEHAGGFKLRFGTLWHLESFSSHEPGYPIGGIRLSRYRTAT